MSRIITFSRQYPSYHPRRGEPTYFVEKIWNGFRDDSFKLPNEYYDYIVAYHKVKAVGEDLLVGGFKHHTVRAGHRWKAGDWFKPVVWGTDINPKSGRSGPYHSKQITFAPDIQVRKTWDLDIIGSDWYLDGRHEYTTGWNVSIETIANNDGLSRGDFYDWFTLSPDFKRKKEFHGQFVCWNETIEYK